MSTHKAAGKASQHVSPAGKRLGLKVSDGQKVTHGMILIRQRGSKVRIGKGVAIGRDHTIYSVAKGKVKFTTRLGRKTVSVI